MRIATQLVKDDGLVKRAGEATDELYSALRSEECPDLEEEEPEE